MYPKLVSVKSGPNKTQTVVYLRLMERVKIDGVWKERVIANLGRQDVAGREALGALLVKLRRFSDEVLVRPDEIESREALEYGNVLVGQKLWEEIGLNRIMAEVCGDLPAVSLGESGVLAMVLNRLSAARSKLALRDWMSTVYLPAWQGERFLKLPTDPTDYAEWYYRTMDWLVADHHKENIEAAIAAWAQTLFPAEVVFYDITNIQFESWQELKQARFGHIKVGRRNHKQILLGLVMVEGLPVACHLFRGNRAEKTTLAWVHQKVKKQFNVGRIITVVDRGQVSQAALEQIEIEGDGYIVALKRRRCTEVEPLLVQDTSGFTPLGWDRKNDLRLAAWEAPVEKATVAGRPDKRRIVVFNPVKAQEDKTKRLEAIAELESALKDLRRRVQDKGQPKTIRTITIAAEKILAHRNGKRYFRYHVEKDRSFSFEPNDEGRHLEEKLDGKWVIKTTEADLSLKDVVYKYKDLLKVEDGFRHLKDFIKVAPVYHWRYRRVKAHVFICVLALLLERLLERKLNEANVDVSARAALEKLKKIRVVTNRVGNLELKYVTPPTEDLSKILAACGTYKLPKILGEPVRSKTKSLPKRRVIPRKSSR
jgi:transposase